MLSTRVFSRGIGAVIPSGTRSLSTDPAKDKFLQEASRIYSSLNNTLKLNEVLANIDEQKANLSSRRYEWGILYQIQHANATFLKHRQGYEDTIQAYTPELRLTKRKHQQGLREAAEKLRSLLFAVPNSIDPDTPPAHEPQIIELSETSAHLQNIPNRDHVRLIGQDSRAQWIHRDIESAVAGRTWPFLFGGAALLELALKNYAFEQALSRGFMPVITPDVAKTSVLEACGFNPRDKNASQTFFIDSFTKNKVNQQTLALSATAEIPLMGMHSRTRLDLSSPKKYVAFSHAFRAEAGARGRDTRGIYRVHQFSKVELACVCEPSESHALLDELVQFQLDLIRPLHLTYRLLSMPSNELGASASRKFDIEAWLPGKGEWGELTSASNCTDFQARRFGIQNKSQKFAHTLNATASAIPRLIVALVENGAVLDDDNNMTQLRLPSCLKKHWLGSHGTVDNIPLVWCDTPYSL